MPDDLGTVLLSAGHSNGAIKVLFYKPDWQLAHWQDWVEATQNFELLHDAVMFAKSVVNPHWKTLICIPVSNAILKLEVDCFISSGKASLDLIKILNA